jgi:oligosaccharyltransferase complex subunit beta
VPPTGDAVQLEFSMLSPFHRLALSPSISTDSSAIFSTTFKLPDQHGIFNFLVEYRRPFLSNINEKTTVTVRHFAHDEWPRSWVISAAWPWMSGIAVTVVGWVAFVALWLWSAPPKRVGEKKTQ